MSRPFRIEYRNRYRCVKCEGNLTFEQVMYSLGRCPLCGHKGEHACTVVETTEYAERVRIPLPRPFDFNAVAFAALKWTAIITVGRLIWVAITGHPLY